MGERIDNVNDSLANPNLSNDSRNAVIIIDSQKTIVNCNPVAQKLFRIRKSDLIGTPFEEFIRSKAKPLNITKLIKNIENDRCTEGVDIELKGRRPAYRFNCKPEAEENKKITIEKISGHGAVPAERIPFDLEYLTTVASQLTEINDEDEVFEFLAARLKELYPNVIIFINRSNTEGTWLKLEKVLGIDNSLFYKLIKLVGFNPIGKQYKLTDEFKHQLSRPKLHLYDGNFYKFSNNEIPESIANLVEKALKLKSIHTIGIAENGQYFGFIHFLSTSQSEELNKSVLESIIYLCYLSISRIKSMRSLEERERQYKLLADNVKDVIFTLDLNLVYTYISPSVRNLRGYEPSEIIGQHIQKSVSPGSFKFIEKLFKEKLNELKSNEIQPADDYLIELELKHRNGSPVWTEVKVSFILNGRNKPVGILGVTRNITDRKMAETELLKKNIELNEANAQKDKLFSIIAHDLKNPFGHILNFSSLLKDHYDHYSEDKRKQFIDLINKSSQQIYLLLENLLDWSRSQGGKMDFFPQKIRIDKTLTNVIDLLSYQASSKSIELKKTVPSDSVMFADEFMIKTILRNLIGNAIKFTPDNGYVKIEVREEKNEFVFIITDNGIGMDTNISGSLFSLDLNISKPGTRGERGTGLGLLLCKEFVERHGGKIWVKSTPGKGSVFTFTVPFKQPVRSDIP